MVLILKSLQLKKNSEFFRNDFEPVAVGVFAEIDAHGGIFITDTAHFFSEEFRLNYISPDAILQKTKERCR